ncbi:MAG: N-acyl amino acid synthase FeeM domain-containing protein [Pseudorhizobium sp.]
MDQVLSEGSFSQKLLNVLDRIEYRRIEDQEDFEDIARLRFKAYKARDVLPVSAVNMLDEVDFDPQAYVFGIYYYEELISTLRVHHVTPDHRVCQSSGIFPEAVNAFLDAGMSLIDPARFAADPDVVGELPSISYLTLRPSIMAAIHFDTDRVLQHIRPAHAAFYRRVFRAETVVAPTMTDTYGFELTLLASRPREVRPRLMERFPFFDSKPYERRLMFDRAPPGGMPPLTILPTARSAQASALRSLLPS